MNKNNMRLSCKLMITATWLATTCGYVHAQVEKRPKFTAQIRVTPQTIVSYEPVRVDFKAQYLGDVPIKAFFPRGAGGRIGMEIRPPAALETRAYSLGVSDLYTDAFVDEVPLPDRTIPSQATSITPIQALYDLHQKRFLFEAAGLYRIKVFTDVITEGTAGKFNQHTIMDEATIQVKAYDGKEQALWKEIVLSGALLGRDLTTETIQALQKLVQQFPLSPYRPYALAVLGGTFGNAPKSVTDAQRIAYLQEILLNYPQFAWTDYVRAEFYPLLVNKDETERAERMIKPLFDDPWAPYILKSRIENFQPSTIFPNDKRLDQMVGHKFEQRAFLNEVLSYLSQETKVPLSLHPDLSKRNLATIPNTTLREYMLILSYYKAQWIRDGDGYKLVPKPLPTPAAPQ